MSRTRFGEKDFAYFFIEAEGFHDNDPRGLGEAFILSSEEDSLFNTVNAEFELDPNAFASGGDHDVQYLVNFDTPDEYNFYIRHHSPLGPELDRNKNDSFYYPVEFGEDPVQYKANGDDYGILESIEFSGDVAQRGPWLWFAAREEVEDSEANPPVDQDPGTFATYDITEGMIGHDLILEFDHRETGVMLDAFLFIATSADLPPTNGEGPDGNGFFGPGDLVDMEFGLLNLGVEATSNGDFDMNGELTAADIDVLNGAIRDGGDAMFDVMFDAMFDVTGDGAIDDADRTEWVEVLKGAYFGGANLDGEFNSSDFVFVFTGGQYEDGVEGNSTWSTGDWNGDTEFGSSDFVLAFQGKGYEQGPRVAAQAVPEPSSLGMLIGLPLLILILGLRRCSR
ncbi:hypothetical protein ACFL2H_12975 [Planctomycetota bacterium]